MAAESSTSVGEPRESGDRVLSLTVSVEFPFSQAGPIEQTSNSDGRVTGASRQVPRGPCGKVT